MHGCVKILELDHELEQIGTTEIHPTKCISLEFTFYKSPTTLSLRFSKPIALNFLKLSDSKTGMCLTFETLSDELLHSSSGRGHKDGKTPLLTRAL